MKSKNQSKKSKRTPTKKIPAKKIPTKTTSKKERKSYIHVLTGNGGGKTTSALGVALRSIGHKRTVFVVQFMKGRKDIGEWKIQKDIDHFKVYQFGRKQFVNMKKPSQVDIGLAQQALGFVEGMFMEDFTPDLLILDEINLAADLRMIDTFKAVEILSRAPKGLDIYLTGRNAPKEFIDLADFATEVTDLKRPKRIPARKGIEY